MATGIVSAGLHHIGWTAPAWVLLAIAAVGFVAYSATWCRQALAAPAEFRFVLTRPETAYTSFAFVAACSVLGGTLAAEGGAGGAAGTATGALAIAAVAGWVVLTALVPVRLARPSAPMPAIGAVNGTWYIWAVSTQSLALAAASLRADHVIGPAGTIAAAVVWIIGVAIYLATTLLIAARLIYVGLPQTDSIAPYWIAMGAASISVFAAASLAQIAPAPLSAVDRVKITDVALALWAFAAGLYPILAALTAVRSARLPFGRGLLLPRYDPQVWMIVFPLGMFAMASMELGTTTGLRLVHDIGVFAIWPAVLAWLLSFVVMATTWLKHAVPKSRGSALEASEPHRLSQVMKDSG